MTALSGTFAFQGEEQLKVFNAAADAINAQGGVLGGRKLEMVPFDNKGNPQDSLVILKQVTDQESAMLQPLYPVWPTHSATP